MLPGEQIRSFRLRRGRLGTASATARIRLWPVYGIDPPYRALTPPDVLEIGSGMGEATAALAQAQPTLRVLAVEVHPAGVAALLRRLDDLRLTHVQVADDDALTVLRALPDGCLSEVRLFFPDPWPKVRHAKRRLIRPATAELIAAKLAGHGRLWLVTDSPGYVEHARATLRGWRLAEVDRGDRPVTGYERRALAAGREVIDLLAHPPTV